MARNDEIFRVLQYLQNDGIRVTEEFVKDIKRLVKSDVTNFALQIYRDFSRREFEHYNKFEKLKLTKKQRFILNGEILWRYEYRNTSNFRCIFIVRNVHNENMPILLCAFNEDGNREKGINSYNDNIERAIKIAQNI